MTCTVDSGTARKSASARAPTIRLANRTPKLPVTALTTCEAMNRTRKPPSDPGGETLLLAMAMSGAVRATQLTLLAAATV